jgi:hypothetical protein
MSTLTELETKHNELIKKLEQINKDKQAEKEEVKKRETAKLLEIQCQILDALLKHRKCIVCDILSYDVASKKVCSDLQIITIPDSYTLNGFVGFILQNKAYSGFTISADARAIDTKVGFYVLQI